MAGEDLVALPEAPTGTTFGSSSDFPEIPNRLDTLVFTNGCFDLLHAGHVKYLQAAAALGNKLIVGVNDDASFEKRKDRPPIYKQDARVEVLRALACVDEVRIFREDTPYELLEELRPDILVKGADYKPCEVVGREFAKVVICIDVGIGVHTSDIIKIIKDS